MRGLALALKDGTLQVRAEDGSLSVETKINTKFTTAPVFVQGPYVAMLLVGMEKGLIAFDVSDLHPLGKIDFSRDGPRGTLTVSDLDGDGAPEVIAVTDGGRVVAVSTISGMSPEQAVRLKNTVLNLKIGLAVAAADGDTNAVEAIAFFKAKSAAGR